MPVRPTLNTERLLLRPFCMADCDRVAALCADPRIADTTLLIPHPYSLADAEAWIETHQEQFEGGRSVNFAVVRGQDTLIGAVGLKLEPEHGRAELGYWIGTDYWGNGYASEAARAVVQWALSDLGVHRIYAYHFQRNAASGRVLARAGLRPEGMQRGHIKKGDRHENCVLYGIVRGDSLTAG